MWNCAVKTKADGNKRLSCSERNKKRLTAKDGNVQVLDAGHGGGQAGYEAHDPIKEGGVGGHGQDGSLAAAGLLTLDHHSKTHAEEVSPPQGGQHSLTEKSASLKKKKMVFFNCWTFVSERLYRPEVVLHFQAVKDMFV